MNFKDWLAAMTREAPGEGSPGGDAAAQGSEGAEQKTDAANAAAGTDDASILGDGKPADTAASADAKGEQKPDDAAKAAADAAAAAAAAADPLNLVPEDGKYVLTLPEGVEIDEQLAEAAFPVFKELGLTTGAANKLAEFFAGVRTQEGEAQAAEWSKQNTKWQTETKADKAYAEVGFEVAAAQANRALNQFGDDELKTLLKTTGMGNHPAMVRFVFNASKAMANDKTERGSNQSVDTTTPEQRMYGATTPLTKKV